MRLLEGEQKKSRRARRLVEQVKMSFVTRLHKRYADIAVKLDEQQGADVQATRNQCNHLIAGDAAILKVLLETPY
jgi:hypothetical protein